MRRHTESHIRTHYPEGIPTKLKDVLEDCRVRERKIRIVLGDPETGKVWLEENDVVGYLGRSTGTQKVLLLLSNRNAIGGPAVSVENILGVLHYNVQTLAVEFLYRHGSLLVPNIITTKAPGDPERHWIVAIADCVENTNLLLVDHRDIIARCKSEEEAQELKKFHQFKRLTPPAYTTVIGIELEGVIDDPEEFQVQLAELLKTFKNNHEVRKYRCIFDTSKSGKWVKTS